MRLVRVTFAALTLFAIANQLAIHARLGFNLVNFFSYFTNLSNLLAAGILLLTAMPAATSAPPGAPRASAIIDLLRALSVINMTLVGIVFAILLRDTDLGSLLPWVNVVLHYVMPLFIVIDWLYAPPDERLGWRSLLTALIFPFSYLIYVLWRGALTGWYPYPFFRATEAGGIAGVAAHIAAITAAFILVGWGVIALGNRRRR
jgi:hypothetical protein